MKLLFAVLLAFVLLVSGCTQASQPAPETGNQVTYANCGDYAHGQSWQVECNTCTCDNGVESCTKLDCTAQEPVAEPEAQPAEPEPTPEVKADKVACGNDKCGTTTVTVVEGTQFGVEWKGEVHTIAVVYLEAGKGIFKIDGTDREIGLGTSFDIGDGFLLTLKISSQPQQKAIFFIYEDFNSCAEDCVS